MLVPGFLVQLSRVTLLFFEKTSKSQISLNETLVCMLMHVLNWFCSVNMSANLEKKGGAGHWTDFY